MTQHESGSAFVASYAAGRAALEGTAHVDLTEHDACGVGLVAALDGVASRNVVQAGIDAACGSRHQVADVGLHRHGREALGVEQLLFGQRPRGGKPAQLAEQFRIQRIITHAADRVDNQGQESSWLLR